MFFLKNLSSTEIFTGDPCTIEVTIPAKVREDKHARDQWITQPTVEHCCYSLWEGANPKLRIRSTRGSENPPVICHGLALDFDAVATDKERAAALARIPFPVYAVEHTLTPGYWRPIIIFGQPLSFSSLEMVKYFLSAITKKWNPGAGWDKPAFKEPNKYYTSSGEFEVYGDVVTVEETTKLFASIFKDYKFREFAQGVSLKIDEIEAQLEKKYPTFKRLWTEPFEFEAQGPTFWIPESTSPKSAIIKQNGIYTFSAHAEKPFYSWTELLGAEFVKDESDKAYGQIAENICRSLKNFYIRDPETRRWDVNDKADVFNMLRVEYGLTAKVDDSGNSALDNAMNFIRKYRRVEGMAPFIYDKRERIPIGEGRWILNSMVGRTHVMQPAPGPVKWGPDGQFPWLSKFLETFLVKEDDQDPLPFFLAWHARFYRSAYYSQPTTGHAVFVSGGTGVGKTFWGQPFLKTMFGPLGDPMKYLTGKEPFGGELLERAIWSINDAGAVASDPRISPTYSERLKAIVANASLEYHIKYQTPVPDVAWMGRVVVTCNRDAHSMRAVIPNTDMSNRDKLMLFRAPEHCQVEFFSREKNQEILDREMPFFCRYLLDYEPPAEVLLQTREKDRFGIKPYYDSVLLEQTKLASPRNNLKAMLRRFVREVLKEGEKEVIYDSTTLYEVMAARFPNWIRSFSATYFIQQLEGLSSDGEGDEENNWIVRQISEHGEYQWKFTRD
jgi:hypothetical protein